MRVVTPRATARRALAPALAAVLCLVAGCSASTAGNSAAGAGSSGAPSTRDTPSTPGIASTATSPSSPEAPSARLSRTQPTPPTAPTAPSDGASGSSGEGEPNPTGSPTIPDGWDEQQVSFDAGDVTVYGTYLHPRAGSHRVPAALLIAGSGPTDRDGNTPLESGAVNTLRNMATALAADGVASLRYDKLGSGRTGLGPFAAHPNSVGVKPFTQEAQAAWRFLARQRQVNPDRMSVFGHSEGALFALQLATDDRGDAPAVHSLGLIEPLSKRYLDVITEQVTAQLRQQRQAGQITQDIERKVLDLLHSAVKQLRTKGTVPANMPYGLGTLFAPSSLTFLREADAIDPAALAARLPRDMPVMITCSDADIQVPCADVHRLADAVGSTTVDLVTLHGVDHVLKQDDSRTAANYGKDLPFSAEFVTALRTFLET